MKKKKTVLNVFFQLLVSIIMYLIAYWIGKELQTKIDERNRNHD